MQLQSSVSTAFVDDERAVITAVFAVFSAFDLGATSPRASRPGMTREQAAVLQLMRLRRAIAAGMMPIATETTLLPATPRHVSEDLAVVGAPVFSPVLRRIVIVSASVMPDLPCDETLLELLDDLEADLQALEAEHGTLWQHLAAFVRRHPEHFVRPAWRRPLRVGQLPVF